MTSNWFLSNRESTTDIIMTLLGGGWGEIMRQTGF